VPFDLKNHVSTTIPNMLEKESEIWNRNACSFKTRVLSQVSMLVGILKIKSKVINMKLLFCRVHV